MAWRGKPGRQKLFCLGREGGDASVTERRDVLTGRPARSNYRVRREEEQEVRGRHGAESFSEKKERKNTGLSVELELSVSIIDPLISGSGNMQ